MTDERRQNDPVAAAYERLHMAIRAVSEERDRYREALARIYQRAKGDVLEIAREALND